MRLERHHPVDGGEGDGQCVEDDSGSTQELKLSRQSRVGRMVLLERPAIEPIGDGAPDDEVQDRPHQKERDVQVERLFAQDCVGQDGIGSGPQVEHSHAERNRQKRQSHDRQRAGGRLEHPANHHSPCPARQVMKHHDRQAPERDAQPQHEGRQIREQKLLWIQDGAERTERQQAAADDGAGSAKRSEIGRGEAGSERRRHGRGSVDGEASLPGRGPSSRRRSSEGTSSIDAR